jgi:hypothetical protein
MASEIHKKRTGKGFKISEEIVMKEEMYEEEDDDLPRQYRALAAHLHTSSPEMNNRLTAYLTNRVAMASLARQQEVNRMFAEQFPHASQISNQLSQSVYYQPLQTNQPLSPVSTQYPGNYEQSPSSPSFSRDRSQSVPQGPMLSPHPLSVHQQKHSPGTRHASIDETPLPHQMSMASFAQSYNFPPSATGNVPVDPSLSMQSPPPSSSVFTSELPPETKMLGNFEMSDPMYNVFMGGMDGGELMGSEGYYAFMHHRKDLAIPSSESQDFYPRHTSGPQSTTQFAAYTGEPSRIGTPGGGDGDPWENWVNTDDQDWVHLQ